MTSMQMQSFPTPEAAATSGFPGARIAASAAEGDDAYVLVDTNPSGDSYKYGVNVHRRSGGWEEGNSGNGAGWTLTDQEHGLGTLVVWADAPANADAVRIAWNGETREVAVTGGVYLAVWWRVPCPSEHPRVVGVRVGGAWRDAL